MHFFSNKFLIIFLLCSAASPSVCSHQEPDYFYIPVENQGSIQFNRYGNTSVFIGISNFRKALSPDQINFIGNTVKLYAKTRQEHALLITFEKDKAPKTNQYAI